MPSMVTVALLNGTTVDASTFTSSDDGFACTEKSNEDPTFIVTIIGSSVTPMVTNITFDVQGPVTFAFINVGTDPKSGSQVNTLPPSQRKYFANGPF